MGTSKASIGPVGNSKPIQDWNRDIDTSNGAGNSENESEQNGDEQNGDVADKTINWSDAKRSFAAFTKNPNKTNYKTFITNYKKASGGSKKLSQSSIGGRHGAVVLLNFLSEISTSGFQETLEKFEIGDISSLQTEGAINKIASLFLEIDGTDEGSAATSAVIETVNKLYNDYSENPEQVDNLKIEQISDYLEFYVSTYIFERISIEVTKGLESGKLTTQQVNDAEGYLKSYIEAEVSLNFTKTNFSTINIKEKNSIIKNIFNEAYSIL